MGNGPQINDDRYGWYPTPSWPGTRNSWPRLFIESPRCRLSGDARYFPVPVVALSKLLRLTTAIVHNTLNCCKEKLNSVTRRGGAEVSAMRAAGGHTGHVSSDCRRLSLPASVVALLLCWRASAHSKYALGVLQVAGCNRAGRHT